MAGLWVTHWNWCKLIWKLREPCGLRLSSRPLTPVVVWDLSLRALMTAETPPHTHTLVSFPPLLPPTPASLLKNVGCTFSDQSREFVQLRLQPPGVYRAPQKWGLPGRAMLWLDHRGHWNVGAEVQAQPPLPTTPGRAGIPLSHHKKDPEPPGRAGSCRGIRAVSREPRFVPCPAPGTPCTHPLEPQDLSGRAFWVSVPVYRWVN